MPRRRQTAHALRILASSWSLRSATANPHRERKTMLTVLQSKPLLCLLNVRHHWETLSADDDSRYERCTKCGKDKTGYRWGFDVNSGKPFPFA